MEKVDGFWTNRVIYPLIRGYYDHRYFWRGYKEDYLPETNPTRSFWEIAAGVKIDAKIDYVEGLVENLKRRGFGEPVLRAWKSRLYFLYSRYEDLSLDEISDNPFLDLMFLVADNAAYYERKLHNRYGEEEWVLTIPNPPRKIQIFEPLGKDKPFQFVAQPTGSLHGDFKNARTVLGYEREARQREVIVSFDLMARVNRRCPGILAESLQKYCELTKSGDIVSPTLGLLEMMYNLGLTELAEVSDLAYDLRDITLSRIDYQTLIEKWPYTVVFYKDFWFRERVTANLNLSFKKDFVIWRAREREKLKSEVERISVSGSITRASITHGGLNEKAKAEAAGNIRRKQELEERLKTLERDTQLSLQNTLAREVNPLEAEAVKDTDLAVRQLKKIIAFFAKDSNLPGSMRILNTDVFTIDGSRAISNPLLLWVNALVNPSVRLAFYRLIQERPEEILILLRQTVAVAGRTFFGRHNFEDFLLNPDFSLADPVGLRILFEDLGKQETSSFVREVFLDEIRKPLGIREGYLDPELMRARRESLEDLIYRRIGPFKVDKRIELAKKTVESFEKDILSAVAMFTVCGGLTTGALLGFAKALDILYERKEEAIYLNHERNYFQRVNPYEESTPYRTWKKQSLQKEKGEQKREDHYFYGEVLHFPEGMDVSEGMHFGFFPITMGDEPYKYGGINFPPSEGDSIPYKVYYYGEEGIKPEDVRFEPDMLVYEIANPGLFLMPPEGYKFHALYIQGGENLRLKPNPIGLGITDKLERPYLGLGESSWTFGERQQLEFPEKVIVVAERDRRINVFQSERLQPISAKAAQYDQYYYPDPFNEIQFIFRDERPRELEIANLRDWFSKRWVKLGKYSDEDLNKIIGSFKWEMIGLIDELALEQLSNADFVARYSDLGIKYAEEFAKYTDIKRFYNVRPDELDEGLTFIGNNPAEGYDCGVASKAFDELFTLLGFKVYRRTGFGLHVFNGNELWGKAGHVKNLLHLPDGRMILVEMVPSVVDGKTPDEVKTILEFNTPPSRKQGAFLELPENMLLTQKDERSSELAEFESKKGSDIEETDDIGRELSTLRNGNLRKFNPVRPEEFEEFEGTKTGLFPKITLDRLEDLAKYLGIFSFSALGLFVLQKMVNRRIKHRLARKKISEALKRGSFTETEGKILCGLVLNIATCDESCEEITLARAVELLSEYRGLEQNELINFFIDNWHAFGHYTDAEVLCREMDRLWRNPEESRKLGIEDFPYEVQLFLEHVSGLSGEDRENSLRDLKNAYDLAEMAIKYKHHVLALKIIQMLVQGRRNKEQADKHAKRIRKRREQLKSLIKRLSPEMLPEKNRILMAVFIDLIPS